MSARNRQNLHVHSLLAYYQGRAEYFSDGEAAILGAVKAMQGGTDLEIMLRLKLPDMNCVRPRITELVKEGLLEELIHATECPITGKKVRMVRIAQDPRTPQIITQGLFELVKEMV